MKRLYVGLNASCRSAVMRVMRTGRTAAIGYVPRGDNQTADEPANGATDKRLQAEVPLTQVSPAAVARFSRNLGVHSNTSLPAILLSAPSRQRHLPNAPGGSLSADVPLVSMEYQSWIYLLRFGASEDTGSFGQIAMPG